MAQVEEKGKTIVQKILSRAAGQELEVGDFGWGGVSVVSLMDLIHFCDWDYFDRNKITVWDPERIIFCFDHFMYPGYGLGVQGLGQLRDWAKRHKLPAENVYDIGRHGNSHQIPVEHGWAVPGHIYVGADTQAPTLGAFNCFTVTSDAETPFIMATGQTWFTVPQTLRINITGELAAGVLGKDIYQHILKTLNGRGEGKAIEVGGPGLSSLSLDARLAVANGGPHMGATCVIFEPDEILLEYVKDRARFAIQPTYPDAGAQYIEVIDVDLSKIPPLVAGPHDPTRIVPVNELPPIEITAAYIGSCSAGRIEDLRAAADILRGRKVHEGVRLVVTPISSQVMEEATREGIIDVFLQAGATVTTPGCGACYVGNSSPLHLADGENCISTSVENWRGRMGSNTASIYLANAATVALSAVKGQISGTE